MADSMISAHFTENGSEQAYRALLDITRAANESPEIGLLIGRCLEVFYTLLPYDFAFALLFKTEPPGIELIEPRNVAPGAHFALESLASFAGSADANRLASITDALREYLSASGSGTPIFMPLRTEAEELGIIVLAAAAETNQKVPTHTEQVFDAAAGQISVALSRLRAVNRLNTSEEMFRAMVTESPDGFWETDGLGVIRYANQAALHILGRPLAEVVGKRIDDLTNRDPEGLRELRRQLRESDYVRGYHLNIRAADGTDKTISQSIRVRRDAHGHIQSMHGIVRDETEWAQNLELLAHRQREADLLHELATRLNDPDNWNEALEKGLDLITQMTHTPSAVVLVINQAQTMYEAVAYRGIEPDLIAEYTKEPLNPAAFEPNFEPEQTRSLMEYLISTRRAVDLSQVFDTPRFTLSSAQQMGYQSGYIVPILYAGQVYGAVVVTSKFPQTFNAHAVRLLDNIAAQLGLALQNQRLVADLQRQVQQIQAVSHAAALIQSAPRAEEGLPGVVREIRSTLNASYVVLQLLREDHFEIVTATDTRETRRIFRIAPYEQHILDSDEPFCVNDIDAPEVDPEQRAIVKRLMLRATLAIRLYAHDHPLGILFVNQETPRVWSPHEAQLLRRFAQQISEALENKRLLDENIHQVRALRSLVYAGRLMTTGLSAANALKSVADEIARVFPADYVCFHLQEADQLRLIAESHEMGAPEVLRILPHQHRILSELMPTIVTDRDKDAVNEEQRNFLTRYGVVADLGVPLVEAHRALGVLYLSQFKAHAWTEAEVRLATLFAQQIAAALTNTRLLQDSKTQVSALAMLGRNATLIGVSRSPESSLPQVARDLREVLGVDYVGFHLLEGDRLHIYTEPGRGMANQTYPVQQYHRTVLDYFQKLVVNDRERDAKDDAHYSILERFGMLSDVGVPMVTRGKAIGIFLVSRRVPHVWSENELRIFEACAQQIATILDNVQLLNDREARVHELSKLAELNELTAANLDIQVLNELALDVAKDLLNANYLTLMLVEGEEFRIFRLPHNWTRLSDDELLISPSIRELLKIKQPLLLDQNHPENFNSTLGRLMLERGVHASLVVPLLTAHETLGLLSFAYADEHVFNDSETRLAQNAANELALAFANARLLREQKTRIEKLTLLSEFILACNTIRDSTQLKAMATRRACEILELKASSIRLVSDGYLIPDASYGFQNLIAREHRIAIDSSLQRILTGQEPSVISDLEHAPNVSEHWRERHLAEGFYSLVMLPMAVEHQVTGILTLYRGKAHTWGKSEMQYAQTIANTLALALANLKEMKTIDQPPAEPKKRSRKGH